MKHSFIDEHSNIESVISRLDARIKVLSFLGMIVCIVLTGREAFTTFALYGAMVLLLAVFSRVPPLHILKRSLVAAPLVVGTALFVPFLPGPDAIATFKLGALELPVTRTGLLMSWNIGVKSFLAVTAMVILTSSTSFPQLLKALESLKCPRMAILVLSFMYRYIFLIEDEFMKMRQAKEARTLKNSHWLDLKVLANMIGVLFIRSYERAESVYLAMCSRGFTGNIKMLHNFQLRLPTWPFS